MASFNQPINPTNDPSYMSLPQGTEKPQVSSALGNLFQGVGTLADLGVTAVDNTFKADIRRQIEEGGKTIFAQHGVDAAADAAATGKAPTNILGDVAATGEGISKMPGGRGAPAGVAKLGNSLTDLRAQYEQGVLSNSMFEARAAALVKQVRAQYPGYEQEIRAISSQVFGHDPIPAARRALLNDLDAEARAARAGVDKDETFIRNHVHELGDDADSVLAGYRSGKTNATAVIDKIIQARAVDAQRARTVSWLGADKAVNEYDKRKVEGSFSNWLGARVFNTMNNTLDATGLTPDKIYAAVSNQGRKPLTAQEQGDLTRSFTAEIGRIEAGLLRDAYKVGANGHSPASVLGDEKVKQMITAAMQPYHRAMEALTTEKLGFAGYWGNTAKAAQDERWARMINRDEQIANANIVREKLGEKAVEWVLTTGSKKFGPFVDSLAGAFTFKMAAGKAEPIATAVTKIQQDPHLHDTEKAQLTFAMVDNAGKLLVAPDAPPGVIASTAKSLFNDRNRGFVGLFDPKDQIAVWTKLSSPEVADKIKKLNDPQLWNQYMRWNLSTFEGLFRQDAQNLQRSGVEPGRFEVRYVPANGQYEARPLPQYKDRYARFPDGIPRAIAIPMNRINAALRVAAPILKADGRDINEYIVDVLSTMGLRPSEAPASEELPREKLKKMLMPDTNQAGDWVR